MSYVDDVIELTVKQNPSEPEFHRNLPKKKYWNL